MGKDVWWDAGNGAGRQRIRKTAAISKTRMHSSVFEIQLLTSVSCDCCVPGRCRRVWPSVRLCFSRRQPAWEIVQICDSSCGAAASRRVICLFRAVDGCEKWQRAWTSGVEGSRKPGSDKEHWPKPLLSLSVRLCITLHFVV